MNLSRDDRNKLKELLQDQLLVAYLHSKVNAVIFSSMESFQMGPNDMKDGTSQGVALRNSIVAKTLISFLSDILTIEEPTNA